MSDETTVLMPAWAYNMLKEYKDFGDTQADEICALEDVRILAAVGHRILANVDNWYDPLYGVPPSTESITSAANQPANPNVEQHVGPVADDYAAIRKRLDQIRAEKETVKGHELPEATPVTLKPWWR